MVKVLKNLILLKSKIKEIQDLGSDAQERLKRDPKLEEISQACSYVANIDKAHEDIRKWRQDNPELAQKAKDAEDTSPDMLLIGLDIEDMIKNMAPCEQDDVLKDCVSAKVAECANAVNQAMQDLAKTADFHAGETQDWKAGLPPSATIKVVLENAAKILAPIEADVVRTALTNAAKASVLSSNSLQDFPLCLCLRQAPEGIGLGLRIMAV